MKNINQIDHYNESIFIIVIKELNFNFLQDYFCSRSQTLIKQIIKKTMRFINLSQIFLNIKVEIIILITCFKFCFTLIKLK